MSHRQNKDRNKPAVAGFPAVDVVIPAYGCFDLLRSCLNALPVAADKIPLNVVIVDDAYPDAEGLQKVVADIPYHITAVRNHENLGYGATCNRGARVGGSEFILFLNTDVELLPFSIFLMVEAMKADPKIAVMGPKLLFPEDSGDPGRPAGKVQHAGMEINIRGEPFHIFVGWDRNAVKVNKPRQVPCVTGAVFLTRRADFKYVNGFDPIWGLGTYEDVDYCYRQSIRGKKVIYLPQAEGYHSVGASAIAANKPYPLQQNLAIFKARWGGSLRWTEWDVW